MNNHRVKHLILNLQFLQFDLCQRGRSFLTEEFNFCIDTEINPGIESPFHSTEIVPSSPLEI